MRCTQAIHSKRIKGGGGGGGTTDLINCRRRRWATSHPPQRLRSDVVDGTEQRSSRKARERPRRGKVTFYYANVTSWSKRAQDYLVTPGSPLATADVAAIVEHHQQGEKLKAAIKQLKKLGWRVSAEEAIDTGVAEVREGRGHGGVWIQARPHLQQKGLPPPS